MNILSDQFINKSTVMPMELAVKMGRVSGFSSIDKFGVNPQVATTTDPEDLWEFGGLYNYDDFGTAPIIYLSSSSVLDTGQTILIQGLDIEGVFTSQTITTNGQSNVSLTTPLWRVFRMINQSSVSITGIVYCHIDASPTAGVPAAISVRAVINDGNNQTLMAIYTIPKGKIGFIYSIEFGPEITGSAGVLAEYSQVHYEQRPLGKVFTVKRAVSNMVGAGKYGHNFIFKNAIPALTDCKLKIVEVSGTMGVFGGFEILIVDEDRFTEEYKQELGQPGC